MFIVRGNTIKDVSYAHISSVESQVKRNWLVVLIGIAIIIGTIYAQQIDNPPTWATFGAWGRMMFSHGIFGVMFYILLGAVLIVIGYRRKTDFIKFSVSGLTEIQELSGDKNSLDNLSKLINERRFSQNTENE